MHLLNYLISIRSLVMLLLLLGTRCLFSQIQLYNDEFSDPATIINWNNINDEEGWNITQLENYNIGDTVSGSLFMLPITESWFGEYRGAYLYKEISGDFVLTTEVSMSARDGVSLPSSTFSLAGIMIREPLDYPNQDPSLDWVPEEQSYIFMSVGRANQNRLSFEIKNTCNSRSCLDVVDAEASTVTLRLIRRGQEIVILSRFAGGTWQIQNRYNRTGLQQGSLGSCGQLCDATFSDTVQIGFVTYTDWEKVSSYSTSFHNTNTLHPDSLDVDPTSQIPFSPDIKSSYDYIRFDSLTIPASWNALDISDPTEITDENLLIEFSFDAEIHCPTSLLVSELPLSDPHVVAHALNQITSSLVVSDQSLRFVTQEGQTLLENGFQINQAATLEVHVGDCPP